jgi:hypothetical protein
MARARRTGQTGLARAAMAGEQIVDARSPATGELKNGWRYTTGGARAGYDFALRAALAKNQRRVEEGIKRPAVRTFRRSRPRIFASAYTANPWPEVA